MTGAVTETALAAGDFAINGFAISASSTDGVSFKSPEGSAIAKANAINSSTSLTGVTAKAGETSVSYTITSSGAAVAAGDLLINGVDIGALSEADDDEGRAAQLVAAINAKSSQTGVSATVNEDDLTKIDLVAKDGRNITTTVTDDAAAAGLDGFDAGDTTTLAALTITSLTGKDVVKTSGTADAYTAMGFDSGDQTMEASTVTGQTVSSVDLSTQENSQKALSILDAAIDTVTNSRANLGAYQNRFEAAISNLETTSTNLQSSRSRILDTDYAKETTNLAKAQIIQQAATAMLAQANQSSQSVLALLK